MQDFIKDTTGNKQQFRVDADFAILQSSSTFVPERNLWSACMYDALEEIGMRDDPEQFQRTISFRTWRQTRNWILSKDVRCMKIGSFDWICEVIDVDAAMLRKMVLNYHCACCKIRVIQEPCRNVVLKRPGYANKVCIDPKFWNPEKS